MLNWIATSRKAWAGPLAATIVVALNRVISMVPEAPTLGIEAELYVAGFISAVVVYFTRNK